MTNTETVATLFEQMITIEKKMQEFYQRLAEMFSHKPEVSDYWKQMMIDEITHVQELEDLRNTLTTYQLKNPADPYMVRKLNDLLRYPINDILKKINNLDDAYQTAHMFEDSEANKIYKFLNTEFVTSDKRNELIINHLITHIDKINYPPVFMKNEENRKSIKAILNLSDNKKST